MDEYTPGPWRVQEGGKYVEGERCTVAKIYHLPDLMDDADAESRANARLIAAAPTLLEALEALIADRDATLSKLSDYARQHSEQKGESKKWIMARAAIAQAKGTELKTYPVVNRKGRTVRVTIPED